MPTFYDPVADAGEASQALRGLAHASRQFDHPEDLYGVLGDVLGGVRSLGQVLDQLAAAHISHRAHAHDDAGDQYAGAHDALAAADELHRASALIDGAEDCLNSAMSAAGRIAWHPDLSDGPEPVRRWVNICYLEGDDADRIIDLIAKDGADAAIEHASQRDYGEETTAEAMENGAVYDDGKLPTEPLSRTVFAGDYALNYSPFTGHVSLYRKHLVDPADQMPAEAAPTVPARPEPSMQSSFRSDGGRSGRDVAGARGSWFEHPGVAAVKQARGLSR